MSYKDVEKLYNMAEKTNENWEMVICECKKFFEWSKKQGDANSKVLLYLTTALAKSHKSKELISCILPDIQCVKYYKDKIIKIIYDTVVNTSEDPSDMQLLLDALLLIMQQDPQNISWCIYSYGKLCRKLQKQQEYLDLIDNISRSTAPVNEIMLEIKYWCIYDLYIKSLDIKMYTEDEEQKFLKFAGQIISNCKQLSVEKCNYNPYVLTIIKFVKLLRNKPAVNYKKIEKLLLKLDPLKLPYDNENKMKLDSGREIEIASYREFYYSELSKAYEKNKKFEECVKICDTALSDIKTLHYNNDIWIKARKYYSLCMIEDKKEKYIEEYKSLVEKYKFWYMYHKLAEVYYVSNKMEECLLYNCYAFDIMEEDGKLISVMYDLFYAFESQNKYELSRNFLEAYIYTRQKYGWNIPQDILCKQEEYNLSIPNKIDLIGLSYCCSKTIKDISGKDRKIKCEVYQDKGSFGFVKLGNNIPQIYFNKKRMGLNYDVNHKKVLITIGKNQKGWCVDKMQVLGDKKHG